ncbi:hypothetical protein F0T03_07200 [Yersinia canariae]|uniref:DUF3800 domain-containing protein n=1 Tax=Yersinia canariae TaxID=2607663 RepID=A0A857EX26_9GAMM|nr:DUF3800 domain-containing protein [Yersinia canariae]QHB31963.1 hypothetical protein F0T03_07200 [Yersinia canariae]
MNIYIDESVHEEFGFMILAYVVCNQDPQSDIYKILSEHSVDEHHSCARMDKSESLRNLRSNLISYLNSNCRWGAFIMPSEYRHRSYADVSFLLSLLIKNFPDGKGNIFFDEGIINSTEAVSLCSDEVKVITCSSHEVCGIQLADLVASFSGIRFREIITGKAKILTYGYDCGYEPPIEAPLGFELFATLRQSMLRENEPLGDEMPEFVTFKTINKGLILSKNLTTEFSQLALKTFGEVYLGCIH